MERTTRRDLEVQCERLATAMRTARIMRDGERLLLEHGSKLNGVSYSLWIGDAAQVHGWRPFGTMHFGFTARDCERSLIAAACGIEAANAAWVGGAK